MARLIPPSRRPDKILFSVERRSGICEFTGSIGELANAAACHKEAISDIR
jgi:hypothetical protein